MKTSGWAGTMLLLVLAAPAGVNAAAFPSATGANDYGQLGLGIDTWSPAPALMGNAVSVAGGYGYTLVLKADGTVWGWGENFYGELGDGTMNLYSIVPVQVLDLSDVVAITCGWHHSLAIRRDGTLWAWGYNIYGQLGNGTSTLRSSPIQVPGLAGVIAIAAGESHTLALRSDGTVWAWGNNYCGQLGDGTTTPRRSPVQVPGLTSVTAISAAGYGSNAHSMALKSDGTVWTWGYNRTGALGDGTTTDRSSPVQALNLSGVTAIAAGEPHSMALQGNGTVWAWGDNGGPTAPMQVAGLAGVIAIAAGEQKLVLKSDGTVWGWGWQSWGEVGDGTTSYHFTPAQTSGLSSVAVIAGCWTHSVAIKSDGSVWEWGFELANRSLTAVPVANLTGVTDVRAGWSHSLALRNDGTVWAWGYNANRQLGEGTTNDRASAVQVTALTGVASIAAGHSHNLAILTDGSLRAWGNNGQGQLGIGSYNQPATPVPVPGLTSVSAVAAGGAHTLALKTDGTLWAWGYNAYGELGDGTTTNRTSPVLVPGLTGVTAIAAGDSHSLALKPDGTVWAWGQNNSGQLGDGTTTDRISPGPVPNLTGATGIAAGDAYSLALKADGTVWAWGYNSSGQLGDGTYTNRPSPVQAGIFGVTKLAAGLYHTLALRNDGTVWGWGDNGSGQLGDGTANYTRVNPVQIPGVPGASAIAAGSSHSLFLANAVSWPPAVVGTWPAAGGAECDVQYIVVSFNKPVLNVSPDDLVLSAGTVSAVTGSAEGPYLFTITGLPAGTITATMHGDITDSDGVALPTYVWSFINNVIVTQQPIAQTVCPGATAQFTVSALGASSYQWQKDGVNLTNGGHYTGATTATLTVSNIEAADAGAYHCIATSPCGSVASDDAALVVKGGTAIMVQPQNQLGICPGSTAIFSITASGENLLYRWRKNGVALTEGGHYAGTATPTLTVTSVDSSTVGIYVCLVRGTCGNVASAPGNLTLCQRSIRAVASVRMHADGEGWISVELTSGNRLTEPRLGGIQKLALTFDGPVTLVNPAGVTVTGWTTTNGALGPPVPYVPIGVVPDLSRPETVNITFDPGQLPDQSCYTISIGPGAVAEPLTGQTAVQVRSLIGDVNGSGIVTLGDAIYTKMMIAQRAADKPAFDLNLSGGDINLGDALLVKSLLGATERQALCP